MFKSLRLVPVIIYSVVAAVLFAIPLIIFLQDTTFSHAWLLYLGNFLFMCAIAVYMIMFNAKKDENAATVSLLSTGHVVTALGVIISVILAFIALSVFVPGIFSSTPDKVLENAPAQVEGRHTNGLVFMVFMNAIVGNVSTGSFVSIILAYYQKRDQTKEGF
jgi:magnesium-transporting ATPase (P-type)